MFLGTDYSTQVISTRQPAGRNLAEVIARNRQLAVTKQPVTRHSRAGGNLLTHFSDSESTPIQQFFDLNTIRYKQMSEARLLDFVTDQLITGKVVGWFEGRAEFGPRALGHRSIIADPINPEMKDIVNDKVKFREEFRPFAPVVLEESATKYFEFGKIPAVKDPQFRESCLQNLIPFMLATVKAKRSAKKIAPAVVHVDGTSRIQIVSKTYHGRYRKLLEVFYRKTKRPILLNTSFNLKGEPIVNSPKDAYKTFMKSGIDVLVIEKYVITKKHR